MAEVPVALRAELLELGLDDPVQVVVLLDEVVHDGCSLDPEAEGEQPAATLADGGAVVVPVGAE